MLFSIDWLISAGVIYAVTVVGLLARLSRYYGTLEGCREANNTLRDNLNRTRNELDSLKAKVRDLLEDE